jgi:hypothetical protein
MELTLDMLAKDIAEKALDNYIYEGKTIREWVDILSKQQICGDCISREEAIKTVLPYTSGDLIADDIKKLPPVIPKGVTVTDFADRCRECGAEYEKMLEASNPFINKPCISEGVCREDKMQVLDKIRDEIEQLPTKTITNWNGCCPDIDYPEIEYVDKNILLSIIDKYKTESEE